MKNRLRVITALTLLALTLSACVEGVPMVSSEDASQLSAEERQIRQIELQRLAQSVGIGCVIGGLSGLLLGNDQDRGRNVLIGTAAGCIVGFAAGQYINTRTAHFGSSQEQSRALIAAADRDIQKYRSLNATTRSLVSQQRTKVNGLNRQLAAGEITAEGYRARMSSAGRNLQTLQNQSRAINDQVNVMKSDASAIRANNGNPAALSQRIAILEAEKRELDSQRRSLSRIYGGIPPQVNLTL